ncbi:hypothetical protein CTEN210_13575 [Chaetoceros tenuissimus]|uniref:Leucine-rich repeat domain-containing protein n=1 Tax=Chaetoceros tenuissimus TaxID=426638 RepID=A0AAD3D3L0_9STRA|nr:hypothetical protein CTEN210_13575 [Chaetoceros tenuissimus]
MRCAMDLFAKDQQNNIEVPPLASSIPNTLRQWITDSIFTSRTLPIHVVNMRVQTEEWRRFIPGVRMYKGKRTLFYNGENLLDFETGEWLIYNKAERDSWEVIIVLPGVEVISEKTFYYCKNVKRVIMADTVQRILECAFMGCTCLSRVRLSRNLEYIGESLFADCLSLTSLFIPPSCREIAYAAFHKCRDLIILCVPEHTRLGRYVISKTALARTSPFRTLQDGDYSVYQNNDEINEWIKNINQNEEFALHRECASYEPSENAIFEIVKHQGLPSIHVKNQIGLTGFEYLQKNPYANVNEQKLINRLILDLMGEITA